jgi:hypothetical protein
LGTIRHRVGANRNVRFLEDLSQKFTEGNLQSTENKTFLIITDNWENYGGKFDTVDQNADLSKIDFNKYHIVVVDNNDESDSNTSTLGIGVNTLERLAEEFVSKGVGIPIIYQSAHPIEDFSDSERSRVASFPNTNFIPKNYAPKISRSKKVARKEIEVGELVQNHEHLSKYTVEVEKVGKLGFIKGADKNRFITFSRAVPIETDRDEYKERVMEKAGVKDSDVNHKMYVLSLFHTNLKSELDNENLKRIGKDYFEFSDIHSIIGSAIPEVSGRLESLETTYNEVVLEQRALEPRIIAHNDAKWDNWFNGTTLGDYGSACPGREYKDVARALLNPTEEFGSTLDSVKVDAFMNDYLALRRSIDSEFNECESEFRRNLYGALVTESLRIAKYKAENEPDLTEGLIKVAETYAERLSQD